MTTKTCRSSASSKSRKRIIFKTDNEDTKKQLKVAFNELLDDSNLMNNRLQKKMDYFYKPYEENERRNIPLGILPAYEEFDDKTGEEFFHKRAKKEWTGVSNTILRGTQDDLRAILKEVNGTMYNDLKEIGKRYYNNEFEGRDDKLHYPLPEIKRK